MNQKLKEPHKKLNRAELWPFGSRTLEYTGIEYEFRGLALSWTSNYGAPVFLIGLF